MSLSISDRLDFPVAIGPQIFRSNDFRRNKRLRTGQNRVVQKQKGVANLYPWNPVTGYRFVASDLKHPCNQRSDLPAVSQLWLSATPAS
jgi:hypothetical protein